MVNELWDERYEIISKLGSGGTSTVYKARRIADGREVAIKVIRDDLENVRESERHFRMEAEALAQMSHRNIRRILNIGEWNGTLYMVTEYVDGQTLKELLKDGALPKKQALNYAMQIAAGLDHAHRKNVVHRDIKPQNILVARDGTAKIADFGIAHMLSQTTRTMHGKDVVGTVHYISPEQASNGKIDARTDIYSFGVLMYEMFTGRVPFDGHEAVAVAMMHIHQIPEEPMRINPAIEKGLNDLILKCMRKKPEARYQTMAELREDLLLYAADPKAFAILPGDEETPQEEEQPRRRAAEDAEPAVHRRRSTEEAGGEPRKKVAYYSEEERARVKRAKRNRVIGVIAGVVLSLVVIAVALSLLIPALQPAPTYEERAVPGVSSLSRDAAVAVLRGENFSKFKFEEENSVEVAKGKVIRTDPEEGVSVPVNTEIVLYLSKGATQVLAVNTVGQRVEEAADALREQGFQVEIEYVSDETKPNGVVIEQSNSTQEMALGSTITLKVVRNIEAKVLVVPNLIGKTLEEAREAILQAGFHVGRYQEERVEDDAALGVSWQSLPEGMEFIYQDGDKPPEVEIDFTVNVSSGYKCIYDFSVLSDEVLDMELIVYNDQGDEIAYRKFSGTNHVTYEYSSSREETVTFELYAGSTRIDKQTLTTAVPTKEE